MKRDSVKAKSGQFPLPLSSLRNKAPRANTNKLGSNFGLVIQTPQTAMQNANQYEAKTEKLKGMASMAAPISHQTVPKTKTNPVHATQHERGKKAMTLQETLVGPRRAMVARLRQEGIKDQEVLAAIEEVPRHQFVEPALVGQAYNNVPLPIGFQQTISQPYIVAHMIEAMRHGKKLQKVLEVGTGCGYQAAVLAKLCGEVYSIERIKSLHELAKKNLRTLRIANLRLHYGDGMAGLPQIAPFDGIIVAAAGLQIPDSLLQQLTIGGRLIAPVGGAQQALHLIERTGADSWIQSVLEGCYFVPLCPGTI